MRRALLGMVIGVVAGSGAGCSSALSPTRAPASAMEFHYRARAHGHAPAAASTMVYRAAAATLATRCQMWPSDSRYFDGALRKCGARRALAASLARLFLEPAASPEVMAPVVIDGRIRWVDLVEELPCD